MRGAEQHNHSNIKEKIVPIGTAAEDPLDHNNRSLKKKTRKQSKGKKTHVNNEFFNHSPP